MDIRNCRECGNIYSYDGFNTCQKCRRAEEEEFQKVKEYVWDNPGAAISEVSQETEVSSQQIIDFLRQGRLEIKGQSEISLPCERCEEPIQTGRFCDKCTVEMERDFKGAVSSPKDDKSDALRKKPEENKLRIADRFKNR